jgi:allantoate deiminase
MTKKAVSAEQRLMRRIDELARVSDEPGRLTRTFLSPAMRRANALVVEWMKAAGLAVREDAVGNVIGRREGARRGAKTLLLGSHLDSVRNAGRFDGALGVLMALAVVEELNARGVQLPFAIEVIGFSEEESVRFPTPYIGSRGYTGQLGPQDLLARDGEGMSLREVLEPLGGRKFSLPKPAHKKRELLGYVEVHIEQGPVLEAENLAVGVVSAIASQTRGRLTFRGKAGHAGTTPMNLRRDALTAAAEFMLYAEGFANAHAPLVATVGTIAVPGGATNVVPGEVVMSLDVRHPNEATGRRAVATLVDAAKQIARRREVRCEWERTMQSPATASSEALSALLEESVRSMQGRSLSLVSGAGHDAVAMAKLCDVAMLFVRCRNGLSHHPDEYTSRDDIRVALQVMVDFVQRLRPALR